MNDSNDAALTYLSDEPDVNSLRQVYEETAGNLGYFFHQARVSYDNRRSYWPGKSTDHRKHGANAFPWDGASDQEVPIIEEKIGTYISLFSAALSRANIRAYPVEVGDTGRARVVSAFLKWMVSSYIKRLPEEMEEAGNYLLEKGIAITYVGWDEGVKKYLQRLDMAQIEQMSPELAEIVMAGGSDDDLFGMFSKVFPDLKRGRFKRALNSLRKTGEAELPVSRKETPRPCVDALAPDADVFFPPYTRDPQRAPFVFQKVFMSAQEIEQKVLTDGWDREWADKVIETQRGVDHYEIQGRDYNRNQSPMGRYESNKNDLYMLVWAYQILIDEEDGTEGIYRTVFHPRVTDDNTIPRNYGKFELLNGAEEYPFVVTKLSNDEKRLYDVRNFSDLLRSAQNQVKVERDGRIDRASMATLPPLMHPPGRQPSDWGPGRLIPQRRSGDIEFGPTPPPDPGSVEVELTLLKQADRLIGLDEESQFTPFRQQFFINKFLTHVRDVLRLAFKQFQRYGPEEIFFRVTGFADPQRFAKGDPEEDFDVTISFDVQNQDPEKVENRLGQFVQLLALDRNGKMDVDRLLEVLAGSVDPALADAVLQPSQEAQQKVVQKVTDDLSKLYSGVEVGAQPSGAQIALQTMQAWAQQPDVAQRLQEDEAFRERVDKYVEQYQFQLQQAQNAEIGKIGTAPAQFQGTNLGAAS